MVGRNQSGAHFSEQDLQAPRLQRGEIKAHFLHSLVLFLGKHSISVRQWGPESGMQSGAQSSWVWKMCICVPGKPGRECARECAPFPRSILLSHLILILQCQEKSEGYRSCRGECGDCPWHARPWHLRAMVVLAVLAPAACWGCSALHTCVEQRDLDQESCEPVYFQSWKLAAGCRAGRKVTLSPPCSCHLQSLPLKAWSELPKNISEDWLFLRAKESFSTTREYRPTDFAFQQEKKIYLDFSGIFLPSETFWGGNDCVNPVLE